MNGNSILSSLCCSECVYRHTGLLSVFCGCKPFLCRIHHYQMTCSLFSKYVLGYRYHSWHLAMVADPRSSGDKQQSWADSTSTCITPTHLIARSFYNIILFPTLERIMRFCVPCRLFLGSKIANPTYLILLSLYFCAQFPLESPRPLPLKASLEDTPGNDIACISFTWHCNIMYVHVYQHSQHKQTLVVLKRNRSQETSLKWPLSVYM